MKLANPCIPCRKLSGPAALVVGLLCCWPTVPGQAVESQRLRGHVPAAVVHAQAVDRLPAEKVLRLAIGLPLRDETGLKALLRQLYDPASPNYHHWLTPEQFTERFGPAKEDYERVVDFARAHGLTVTVRHPNRVVLDVEGAVPAIEKAFHITLRVYPHPTESRTFYAPDSEPVLDLAVPVLHIAGLDNYSLPQPNYRIKPLDQTALATPNTGSGPNGSFRGSDFRAAYVPGVNLTGVGQSVGLLQFDGYYAADITRYEAEAGLPNVPLINVPINGGVPMPGGNNVEVCLDIEMALSMAPGLSAIYVYEAHNPSPWVDILSRMANDNLCKQLSCSWYEKNGKMDPATDQIFQQMAAQGQSFFNASGDYDAFCGLIDFAGDTPYITQVGGTTLTTTGPGGAYVSERVWNRGNGIGSGGGISTQYAIPSYQVGLDMTANQGSTTMRNIPDVALTADNVYVTYNSGRYSVVGGTSCSAPLWAGLTALINERATTYGRPTLGLVNPAVYAIGNGGSYLSAFHDITVGNNLNSCSPNLFYAVAGYDLCTGWGTPAGSGLIDALAGPPDVLEITPYSGFLVTGDPGGPFDVTSQTFWLTNAGASTFDWSLSNTSFWFTASSTGGSLAPGATDSVTFSLNAVASNAVSGTYSATASFTNLSSGIVQNRGLTLLVLGAPVITTQPADQSAPMGGTATFSVGVIGVQPLSLAWRRNGELIEQATDSSFTTGNLHLADNGSRFSCLASNADGTALSADAVLTVIQVVDHFAWSAIAPTQAVNMPFLITLMPKDPENGTVTNYYKDVSLSGWTNGAGGIQGRVPVAPASVAYWAWSNGIWNGAMAVGQIASNMVLTADDGEHSGSSNPFDVISAPIFSGNAAYLRSRWADLADNEGILSMVFGTNWQDLRFETCNPPALLSSNTRFIFMDGGANNEVALGGFLTNHNHFVAISNWVAAGGSLWVNLAPTPASATVLYLGFGVTLGPNEEYSAGAPNPSHPIFGGPFLPAGAAFTGAPFSEAFVFGSGLKPLLTNVLGQAVLAEKPVGAGHVIFSGMTLPASHSPQPQGTNLLANILVYAASGGYVSNLPPSILQPPAGQAVATGGAASFMVAASGTAPLSYSWRRNGVAIAAASLPTYSTNNVQLADSGAQFSCLVSNAYGTTASLVAVLTVTNNLSAAIVAQPVNQALLVGGTAAFSVAATGAPPLSYFWERNGALIAGATASAYTTNHVQLADSGAQFSCLVSNACGTALSSNAVLTVIQTVDHFVWSPVAPTQFVSTPFAVTITAKAAGNQTVGNFVGWVSLSSSQTNCLLGEVAPNWSGHSGTFTLGYAFTPTNDLRVTHVRHYFGTKVSIWTDAGVLLVAQNVANVPGTWMETPLATPITLAAGTRYRVGVLSGGGTYYRGASSVSTFKDGTLNQSYEASGDAFPGFPDSDNWWLVDLRYTTGAALPLVITPTICGSFVGGSWAGDIAVLQAASNVMLTAADGAGRTGSSQPFQVVQPINWYSFDQTNPITINDDSPATPYPSVLVVSNLPGAVWKATVTVRGLAHDWPEDVGMLLVGPQGQKVELMADAGGGQPIAGVTLSFDDDAAAGLTAEPIRSGTYKPGPCGSGEVFAAPAPVGPYGSALAGLLAANPNGTWALYVQDDASGEAGYVAAGWGLTLGLKVSPPGSAPVMVPGTLRLLSNGQFEFQLAGTAWCTYEIEASADLRNWKVLKSIMLLGSTTNVLDESTNVVKRFYRARLVK